MCRAFQVVRFDIYCVLATLQVGMYSKRITHMLASGPWTFVPPGDGQGSSGASTWACCNFLNVG